MSYKKLEKEAYYQTLKNNG